MYLRVFYTLPITLKWYFIDTENITKFLFSFFWPFGFNQQSPINSVNYLTLFIYNLDFQNTIPPPYQSHAIWPILAYGTSRKGTGRGEGAIFNGKPKGKLGVDGTPAYPLANGFSGGGTCRGWLHDRKMKSIWDFQGTSDPNRH